MPQTSARCEKRKYSWPRKDASRERDYTCARIRANLPRSERHLERGYQVATHFAEVIAARSRNKGQTDLAKSFRKQVGCWKDETGHLFSITKALAHPSYLRIIGLAGDSVNHEIERLLLRELESDPDHWFAALSAVTGEDPVKPECDFDESVSAWLEWGREKGII